MMQQYYVGIDIGSTASKVAVLCDGALADAFVLPTGWNGRETARQIYDILTQKDYTENMRCVATGYGRVSVDYADRVVTEITCHGKGGFALFGQNGTVLDIGGQDTKVIHIEDGQVTDFLMNDKCAAGTGKFIEVMANRLGLTIDELFEEAGKGTAIPISSICTVFAESEVINYMGEGKSKEDLAAGVIDSVAQKVVTLMQRKDLYDTIIITGGLSSNEFFAELLSKKLKAKVIPQPDGRYAGALGAALIAKDRFGDQ